MADAADGIKRRSWLAIATGVILVLVGAPIAYGGAVLIGLGGSAYYLPIGVGLVVSGLLLAWQRSSGVWLYAIIYVVTLLWAVAEVGFDFWPLAPRVIAPTVLAIPVLLCLATMTRSQGHARVGIVGAATITLLLVAFGIAAMYPHSAIYGEPRSTTASARAAADAGDWTAYGRTNEGRRFAPFTEINKQNIGQLQVAWITHTGDGPDGSAADADEDTPLQIGDKLITCSPHSIVHALDVETGKLLWTYDPHLKSTRFQRCRGVGYFKSPTQADVEHGTTVPSLCLERIVMTTVDDHLIELDLATGKTCAGFGSAGIVDLKAGLGDVPPGYAIPTSAPTVAGDLIVVGSEVIDSVDVDVPSGVVRAFDAATGDLRWAWDLGNARDPNAQLSNGAVYTRGTPNVWAPPSVDEKLGLIFLPTGNPSPDHWGGYRTPAEEKYGSSVVALELATGKVRWVFQTTHHDLWDYDVASQPTLYDIPDGRGGRIPALIQPTKRGQIFVLDRRTGTPITRVQEKAVPQGAAPGDRTSPTQPYSVGMPTISSPRIKESDMWGLSPLDQLWCRITFRKLRYEGDFTPPHPDEPGLLFPATMGGMNWGSAAIDESNDYLIVNDGRMAQVLALIERQEADRDGEEALRRLGARVGGKWQGAGKLLLQKGTPYAATYYNFMSPLEVPCPAPPLGTLTAIDLKTKKIAWQVPIGTTQDIGPLRMAMHLPMPVGLPTSGGSLVTRSGLIFFAGTQDFYLRAIDSSTGREIWKSRLPVGADATPMSYISPRSKRQFIVVSAGGSAQSKIEGDYVIAYTLRR